MNLFKNLPNIISVIRLILGPVILFLLIGSEDRWALILFIVACVSDLADGYLARKFDLRSKFGALIDPLADKLLVFLLVTFFVSLGKAPWWWFGTLLIREISLLIGVLLLKSFSIQVELFPTWIGKSATAMNMFALFFLIAFAFKPILVSPLVAPLIIIATIFTFISFVQYTRMWFVFYNNKGE